MNIKSWLFLSIFASASMIQTFGQDSYSDEKVEAIKIKQKALAKKVLPEVDSVLAEVQKLPRSPSKFTMLIGLAEAIAPYNKAKARNLEKEVISEFTAYAERTFRDSEEDTDLGEIIGFQNRLYAALQQSDPMLAQDFLQACKKIQGLPELESNEINNNADTVKTPEEVEEESPLKNANKSEFPADSAQGNSDKDELNSLLKGMGKNPEGTQKQIVKYTEVLLSKPLLIGKNNADSIYELLLAANLPITPVTALTNSSAQTTSALTLLPRELSDQLTSKIINEWIVPNIENKESEAYESAFQILQQLALKPEEIGISLSSAQSVQLKQLMLKISPDSAERFKLAELRKSGSAEAIFLAGAKAPKNAKYEFFSLAAQKAIEDENFELAQKIAKEKKLQLLNSGSKTELLNALYGYTANAQIPKAMRLLPHLKKSEYIEGLISIADAQIKQNKISEATNMLEEALGLTSALPLNQARSNTLTSIASSYVEINPRKSLEIVASIVDQVNEISRAYAVIAVYRSARGSKDSDNIFLQDSMKNDFSELTSILERLGRREFNATNQLLDRFQRADVKLSLRVAIIEGILTPYTGGCGCAIW